MVEGATQSAAKYFTRVSLDRVLYTDNFAVDSDCIGCGRCAKICPAYAIRMKDRRPVWVKDTCLMCFGCLRRCPTESIRYGNVTAAEHKRLHPEEPKRKVFCPA